MPKFRVNLGGEPLLDIVSYGRRVPEHRGRLTPAEIAQVSRTVRGVPEAVVKVLSRDSNKFASVAKHLNYIGRHGELELETDDGDHLKDKDLGRRLTEDWDLDLDEHRRQSGLAATRGRTPPKLVHKLVFSMPPGTPSQSVLAAARKFLREEFALKHRYAFALHSDEAHPHVHATVKAVSEQGVRLHIKKATLRDWRRKFAQHLREQGIEANATERAVRGESRTNKIDGIYRAARRGASTHSREQVEAVAGELLKGGLRIEPGKIALVQTRKEVERGWRAVGEMLVIEGQIELAAQVRRFVDQMPPPRTEKERVAAGLVERVRANRVREGPTR
jgi:hypothetical protein